MIKTFKAQCIGVSGDPYLREGASASVSCSEIIFSSPEALTAADNCSKKRQRDNKSVSNHNPSNISGLNPHDLFIHYITLLVVALLTPSLICSNGPGCASIACESASSKPSV